MAQTDPRISSWLDELCFSYFLFHELSSTQAAPQPTAVSPPNMHLFAIHFFIAAHPSHNDLCPARPKQQSSKRCSPVLPIGPATLPLNHNCRNPPPPCFFFFSHLQPHHHLSFSPLPSSKLFHSTKSSLASPFSFFPFSLLL